MSDYDAMKDLTFDGRDEFSRKPIAEKIIKLLDSDIDVSPLIIDGKWGTGKTEFCFKFKNLLPEHLTDHKVGYVNAFQADHANEPLLTLIAEVAGFYDEDNGKRQNFIASAIPYLRLVTGLGVKAALGFAFGRYAADIPEELADGIGEIKEGSKSLIDQSLESLIKDQVEAEKNLTTLRDALTDIASTNPIILLIDELDRCRPDFAVMMLETIKHVFDVKNVQIILVTNVEQLKATIKHSYGSETNSHDYLYKFFKYQINLPTVSKDEANSNTENNIIYFHSAVQVSKVISENFKNNSYIYDIAKFTEIKHLSLRNIEQIVRCIETLIIFEDNSKSKNPEVEQLLIVFLSFAYIASKKLFEQIRDNNIQASDILGFSSCEDINLSSDNSILEQYPTKFLILLIFHNLAEDRFIRISNYDGAMDYASSRLIERILNKFNFTQEVSISSYYVIESSYIYKYIDHTINNLLLFDIVK